MNIKRGKYSLMAHGDSLKFFKQHRMGYENPILNFHLINDIPKKIGVSIRFDDLKTYLTKYNNIIFYKYCLEFFDKNGIRKTKRAFRDGDIFILLVIPEKIFNKILFFDDMDLAKCMVN